MTDTRSIGRHVLKSAGWIGASKLLVQVVQFGCGLLLVRLLAPADFGMMASVLVITNFAIVLFEGGLRSALVQHPNPSSRDYSTVFWVNLLSGLVLAVGIWLSAHQIAAFYQEPKLESIAPIVGLTFACQVSVVHAARLQRQLRFKIGAAVEALASIAGLGLTLILAAKGAGVYALAIGPVVAQILASIGYAAAGPWRPSHFISRASWRSLLTYALPLVGANATSYWGQNADNLLVGRFLGAASLGFYNRAYNLMLLPLNQVTEAVGAAVFPALATMRDDLPRTRSAYRRSFRAVTAVTLPMMVGLAATAGGLVPVLWGDKWSPTIPLLQILCLAGIPQCLSLTTDWILQAHGRTRLMFKMTLLWTAVGVPAMLAGLHWGTQGIAWAVFIRYALALPLDLYVAARVINLRLLDLIQGVLPVMLSAAMMGVAVWVLPEVFSLDRRVATTLVLQLLVGLAIHGILSFLFSRSLYAETLALLRSS